MIGGLGIGRGHLIAMAAALRWRPAEDVWISWRFLMMFAETSDWVLFVILIGDIAILQEELM